MALQVDKEWHCKVTHYENQRVVTRRINSIVIQAVDGRAYRVSEDKLPDAIALFTGEMHSGDHVMEVIMNPKPPTTWWNDAYSWPTGRDFLHFVIGLVTMAGLVVVSAIINYARSGVN